MSQIQVPQVATVTLTDAQIKALPTTAFEIAPAQGAGIVILPIFVVAVPKLTTSYTNIDPEAYITPTYGDDGFEFMDYAVNAAVGPPTSEQVTHLLSTANKSTQVYRMLGSVNSFGGGPALNGDVETFAANQPLKFFMSNASAGNLTGGHASNTLTLTAVFILQSI